MKARIAHILRETPVLFIGTVLVIAVTFRVGIGAVKSASGASEALDERPAAPLHAPVASSPTPAKTVAPAVATPIAQAEPTVAAPAMPEPLKPLAKRKAPRIHGKR